MSKRANSKINIHGVILLDKPTGMTSNTALQKIKYNFNAKKAGHTGSLDPLATGLLPICLGQATKVSEYLTRWTARVRLLSLDQLMSAMNNFKKR